MGNLGWTELVMTGTLDASIHADACYRAPPPRWQPSEAIQHCVECHGPDDMWHEQASMNHQQGHMECLMCHTDHTQ